MTGLRRVVLGLLGMLLLGCGTKAPPPAERPPFFTARPFPAPRAEDFAVNPRLGIESSRGHLLVAFTPEADDAAIEAAVTNAECTLEGADPNAKIGMLRLRAPASWEALEAARQRLEQDPAVAAVVEDLLLSPDTLPQRAAPGQGSAGPSPDFTHTWDVTDPRGGAWWAHAIHAPVAWNLRPVIAWLGSVDRDRPRRIEVGVIDQGFQLHTDLVGTLFVDHAGPDAPKGEPTASHGTGCAGLIGAAWNGRFADGVSPFVEMRGMTMATIGGTDAEAYPRQFGSALSQVLQALQNTRPRVVSMSLGFNWYQSCYEYDDGAWARCDPKRNGPWLADSQCTAVNVRAAIEASAGVLAPAVRNSGALFFVSAGNNAGSMEPRGDFCSKEDDKFATGLGDFPADLGSPMTYLGLHRADAPVVVVGALAKPDVADAAPERAWFSSLLAGESRSATDPLRHLMAPGEDVTVLAGGRDQSTLEMHSSGTSEATPIAAGAAAYLLALDPTLKNDQLSKLLRGEGVSVAGEPRPVPVLDLGRAVRDMDVLMEDGRKVPAVKLLADVDDGTPDGFTRYDDAGNPWVLRREDWYNVRVDMPDMRAFRDMWWMTRHKGPPCPPRVPACDLNGDGHVGEEPYPRIAFHGQTPDDRDLELFIDQWDGEAPQPFPAASIPALLHSADLHIRASKLLQRAGAELCTITLTGDQAPDAARLASTAGTVDLPVTRDERIVTTPFLQETRIEVRVGERVLSGVVGPLDLAEDRTLVLNPCALDPESPVGLLDPLTDDCRHPPPGTGDVRPSAHTTSCAALRASDELYFCFSMSGGAAPTRELAYRRVGEEVMRAYYRSVEGRTFIRMSGALPADGIAQNVVIDAMVLANGPAASPWPDDYPVPFAVSFGDQDFITGHGTTGSFAPRDGVSSGSTRITRMDPVGGIVEGTFAGTGRFRSIWPSEGQFEDVSIVGEFRVRRTEDR